MITPKIFRTVIGESTATLISTITRHADEQNIPIFLVGGIVRDILLARRNLDVDLVIEGDAISFSKLLRDQYGGEITSFKPFGTSTWVLNEAVAQKLNLPLEKLPKRVDFATARTEIYENPAALPTVRNGHSDIKADLARRDFTINTLALHLNNERCDLLDEFGGASDIRDKIIRVLHNQSFIDDPTRILRALRFEHRFGFTIEPQTESLLQDALPMLRRVTGERIRNELTLALSEPPPEKLWQTMAERGILSAIHDDFVFDQRAHAAIKHARDVFLYELSKHLIFPKIPGGGIPAWVKVHPERVDVYWHLIAAFIPLAALPHLCKRLLFAKSFADSLIDAAQIVQSSGALADPDAPPSQITAYLENKILDAHGDLALFAAWLAVEDDIVRQNITRFASTWRSLKPSSTGHDLAQLGLKPGKCYGIILAHLRAARLDEDVTTDEQERALLMSLIEKHICDE